MHGIYYYMQAGGNLWVHQPASSRGAVRITKQHVCQEITHISYVVLVHQAFNAVLILKDMHVPCVKGEGEMQW
jgi:hypothetical protein